MLKITVLFLTMWISMDFILPDAELICKSLTLKFKEKQMLLEFYYGNVWRIAIPRLLNVAGLSDHGD